MSTAAMDKAIKAYLTALRTGQLPAKIEAARVTLAAAVAIVMAEMGA